MSEIQAQYKSIFVPGNKQSAWVYKQGTAVQKDTSKEHQGVWAFPNYTIEKKSPVEVWVFWDDDPHGVPDTVLHNNPMQGAWGVKDPVASAPSIRRKKFQEPSDMVFYPPDSILPKKRFQVLGVWVKPMYKRDMSALEPGTSGFMPVSGYVSKGEKHSVSGGWKLLGHNDVVVRGKSKKGKLMGDDNKSWMVNVRTPKGEVFPIYTQPGTKVSKLKEKILTKKGIPIENQRLFFEEKPLQEEKTLVGSGIRNADTIDMANIDIFVRTSKGKKFKFEVDPNELVEDVKAMAEPKVDIPADEQRLFFKNVRMENGQPISKYGVKHKGVLDLGGMFIYVQPVEGDKFELDVDPGDDIQSVKKKVKNRTQIAPLDQHLFFREKELTEPTATLKDCDIKHKDTLFLRDEPDSDNMIIFILKDWDKEKFQLEVTPKHTGMDVKKMIKDHEGVPVKEQILTFKRKLVKHSKTLDESKIRHKSILHLERVEKNPPRRKKPQEISINLPGGGGFQLPVDPDDTIRDVKRKVAERQSVPFSHVRLKFDDDGIEPEDSAKPIPGRSYFMDPPEVTIRSPDGDTIDMPVTPDDTMDDLRRQVAKRHNVPFSHVRLVFEDDGVQPDGTAKPIPGRSYYMDPAEVTIRTPNGDTVDMPIAPGDTIEDVKKDVARRHNIPFTHVRLRFDDEEEPENDDRPILGRCYHLDPPEVEVCLPDDKRVKIALPLTPHLTMGDIKDVIEKETGTPKAMQRLFFLDGDEELDDSLPVDQAELTHGSKIEDRGPPVVRIHAPLAPRAKSRDFELIVDPDDTIKDIKRKAAKQSGVPPKHLRLLDENGAEPKDRSRPIPGRSFYLEPPCVHLTLPDDTTVEVPLPLGAKKTVTDLKKAIKEKTGTPRNQQRLFMFDSDEELMDDIPLVKTDLTHRARVESRGPIEGTIEAPSIGPAGRSFQLIIDPEDDTDDLTRKAAKRIGIPVKDLRLFDEDGEELGARRRPQRNFKYVAEVPQITVELDTGEKLSIGILPTQTIGDIKGVIEEKMGKPRASQRVFLFDSESDLSDEVLLVKAGIGEGTKLVVEAEPTQISVVAPTLGRNGRSFQFVIEPEDKVKDIKRKAAKLIGIPVKDLRLIDADDKMEPADNKRPFRGQIFEAITPQFEVELPDKTIVEFPLLPKQTIGDLKEIIEIKTGTKRSNQRIFFFDGHDELDDSTPVRKAKIKPGTKLELRPSNVEQVVEVKFRNRDGRVFVLDIEPNATVREVKKRLREKVNLPVGGFVLGDLSLDDLDEDDVFLDSVRPVRQGAILDIEPPQLEIELPGVGKKISLTILPTTTMSDVRRAIDEQVPEYRNARNPPRIFFMDDDESIDESTPLVKMDLENGLKLQVRSFLLKVKHWNGEVISIHAETTEYIGDIKEKIRDHMGVPISEQRLSRKGKSIPEDMILEDIGLKNKSTIVLEPMSIAVRDTSGTLHTCIVEPEDIIHSIKKILSKKVKLPVGRQCLLFGGVDLKNTSTLAEIGIHHGDELKLELFVLRVMDWMGDVFDIEGLRPIDSIGKLKSVIADMHGLKESKQTLTYNGAVLDDCDATLASQGVPHKAVLVLGDPEKIDLTLPDSSAMAVGVLKAKKFKLDDREIWPTVPDWKRRIFFFDNSDQVDSLVDLTVMHWAGSTFTLRDVDLGISVRELKQLIQELHQIPVEGQRVTMDGKLLDSRDSLRRQLVKHRSVLVLEGKREKSINLPETDKVSLGVLAPRIPRGAFTIQVKHWHGHTFSVQVEPTDYIDDIRDVICEAKGIPVENQRFAFCGEPINDVENLLSQGIKEGAILEMQPMKIQIKLPNGMQHSMAVEAEDTILDLKKRLVKKSKIQVHLQRIMYAGSELSNEATLLACGIDHEDVVGLEVFMVNVMHWTGETFVLDGINVGDTVDRIMQEIQDMKHIAKDRQKLLHNGRVLDSSRTLQEESISHKTVLILEPADDVDVSLPPRSRVSLVPGFLSTTLENNHASFDLTVKHWKGTLYHIQSDPLEYLDDVKEKLKREHGIPIEEQRLLFRGMPLVDDSTLQEQGILDNATLDLIPMKIFVDTPSGKLSLEVENLDTIRGLKQRIFERLGGKGPKQDMCIVVGGLELDDRMTLRDCQIDHGDTVQMEYFRITVMHWCGEPFDLETVRRNDSIESVRNEIEESHFIPRQKQRLVFQGKRLDGTRTLAEECIAHRSMLVLEPPDRDIFDMSSSGMSLGATLLQDISHNGDVSVSEGSNNDLFHDSDSYDRGRLAYEQMLQEQQEEERAQRERMMLSSPPMSPLSPTKSQASSTKSPSKSPNTNGNKKKKKKTKISSNGSSIKSPKSPTKKKLGAGKGGKKKASTSKSG